MKTSSHALDACAGVYAMKYSTHGPGSFTVASTMHESHPFRRVQLARLHELLLQITKESLDQTDPLAAVLLGVAVGVHLEARLVLGESAVSHIEICARMRVPREGG